MYVGPVNFPSASAQARRILGNCKSLQECGYNVSVLSGVDEIRESICLDNIKVSYVEERSNSKLPRWLKNISYFDMGKKTINYLDNLSHKPDFIILYGGYSPFLIKLLNWCKKFETKLIFDAVEWYEASHQKLGFFSPYQINIELAMRYFIPKCDGVICISSFLESFYRKKGVTTSLIPPTLDTSYSSLHIDENVVVKKQQHKKMTISYTGTPGKKDLFDHYLEAFFEVDPRGKSFKFIVAGVEREELMNYPAFKSRALDKLPGFIDCRGRVSHKEAVNIVENSDFTLLLRPQMKYSKAGFPTKVVESLSLSTPVICNMTSDLCDYLIDNYNSIICSGFDVKDLTEKLLIVSDFDPILLEKMKVNARNTAVYHFDYKNYSEVIDDFLQNL
ncbi:hypothetical protein BCU70_21395 [Vibrio sp. 10N.286.49.C2]|nr:hypothetical protein BCU70_21395 [Vibrio sp. 10N.286.49.C2]PMH47969.1 hypothetical protein BCU66_21710 [Vibrio sp. 10N.286.49.B1]